MVTIKISWTDEADQALGLPRRESPGAAGLDLKANLLIADRLAGIGIAPGAFTLVPTGLRVALPPGYEAQVRPRSGLAYRSGVTVLNSPGTIDSDYRGEIRILLVNFGTSPASILHGDRIAQLVIAALPPYEIHPVRDLDSTTRGHGGFGSTGR